MEGLGEKIDIDVDGIIAAAPAKKGDILFAMSTESVVTAHAAYNDPDLLSLRPIAQKAGPGFGVVAVAALLAAEEVRGYRRRLVSSCAPEAPGTVEPSEWGPALRPLWASDQLDAAAFIDPDVAPIVDQGCAIVLPLLEAAAPVVVGAQAGAAGRADGLRADAGPLAPRGALRGRRRPLVVARRPRARRPPEFWTGFGGAEAAAELRQGRGRQRPDRRGRAVGVAPARRRGRGADGGVRARSL